jgi:hypothetical protein
MVQHINGKHISKHDEIIQIESDLVIIENFPIFYFDRIKIKGNCKVLLIVNSYITGDAKNEIKKIRKNNPDESDDEYDFYEDHYCFDLTEINGLEIVVDACDTMANKYYPKVASNKCKDGVEIISDKNGDCIFDFIDELMNGSVDSTLGDLDKEYIKEYTLR